MDFLLRNVERWQVDDLQCAVFEAVAIAWSVPAESVYLAAGALVGHKQKYERREIATAAGKRISAAALVVRKPAAET